MILVTHKNEYVVEGCAVCNSLSAAIDMAEANHESELFIIGGGEIFRQAIDLADKIYLTNVHTIINADVFFPKFYLNEWEIIESERITYNKGDDYASDFKILQRAH